MTIGVSALPHFPKDNTDRNRTSPFAFTGNKFEFRMPGSSFSIAGPNIVLNTIVAESLAQFADILEKSSDFKTDLNTLVQKTIRDHKRIIFNGNNYSAEWSKEAEKRGLLNLKTTPETLPCFVNAKNVDLFVKHGVLSETEIHSRHEILLENYCKTIHIEALTMLEMIRGHIIPATVSYQYDLANAAITKKSLQTGLSVSIETNLLLKLSKLSDSLVNALEKIEASIIRMKNHQDTLETANFCKNVIIPDMHAIRIIADEIESLVGKKYWTLPTYGDLLYSI